MFTKLCYLFIIIFLSWKSKNKDLWSTKVENDLLPTVEIEKNDKNVHCILLGLNL